MTQKEEKELIRQAQNDYQAFGELYDKYYSPIYRYILHRVADRNVACDITSQTFFKALKSIKKYQWQGAPFSAWLYRIAHNEVVSYYRKQKFQQFISIEPLLPFLAASEKSNPEYELDQSDKEKTRYKDFTKLHKALVKLSQTEQSLITLRFFEKKKLKTIGQILDVPEGTVKSRIHRSLRKLERILTNMGGTKK